MYVYGSDQDAIMKLIAENPEYGKKLSDKYDYTVAEVVWAVREEMAREVEDVLARRVRLLFVDAREAIKAAPLVAEVMAKELGKDQAWIDEIIQISKDVWADPEYSDWIGEIMLNRYEVYGEDANAFLEEACEKALPAFETLSGQQ